MYSVYYVYRSTGMFVSVAFLSCVSSLFFGCHGVCGRYVHAPDDTSHGWFLTTDKGLLYASAFWVGTLFLHWQNWGVPMC